MLGVREVVGRPRYAHHGTLGAAMAMIRSRASAAIRQVLDDLARMARRRSVGPVVAARLEELFRGLAEYGLRLNYHGWRG